MRILFLAGLFLLATAKQSFAFDQVMLTPTERGLDQVELFVASPDAEGPRPVILFVHGYQWEERPGGLAFAKIEERPEIATIDEGRIQEMAKRGYIAAAVSQPGFGESAGPSDFCGPRTQQAVMAAFDYLLSLPNADPTRVVLYGVSRGAATSSMVATQDDRITDLILMAGLYDLEEFYPSGDKYLDENIVNETGATPEAFAQRAALRYADRITARTLILHGDGDNRGHSLDQAKRLAERLEENGTPVRLRVYEDRPHQVPIPEQWEEIDPFLARIF